MDDKTKKHIRYFDIVAQIELDGLIQDAKITDINSKSVSIDKKIDSADSINIILYKRTSLSFFRLKKHECKIVEHTDESHTSIQFLDELTPDEMLILGVDRK
ncbi:MAG: hypothetical protein JXK07_16705 [Spirochaetes bacterium]|nr:hypothetical protein [Spirochaetota bacterium]